MSRARSDRERWHALLDALSDETGEMSDEMIMREFGANADQACDKMRNLIRDSVGDVDVTPYEATKGRKMKAPPHEVYSPQNANLDAHPDVQISRLERSICLGGVDGTRR